MVGYVEIAELLLSRGARVDAKTNVRIPAPRRPPHAPQDGWTPLMGTSRFGSVEVVRLLLRHGAAVNHQDVGPPPLPPRRLTPGAETAPDRPVLGVHQRPPRYR